MSLFKLWNCVAVKGLGFTKSIACFSTHPHINESFIAQLENILEKKGKVAQSFAQREQHSHDEGYHKSYPPDVVIWPKEIRHIAEIMKLCTSKKIPVVPFGTGTGLEGGVTAINGGVCLDLNLMESISNYFPDDFNVTVQPAVTRTAINHYVKGDGLWFPVDPGADASLCGMAATAASGTNAVRYGTMQDNVINMEVVLPNGDVLHTNGENRRFRKTSAGYNLNDLFIGSEGTLGIITSATLKLHGIPETILAAVCHFESVKEAVDCVVNVLQWNIPIARIELLDAQFMNAVNKYSHLSYDVAPTLFLEFHGSLASAEDQVNLTKEIVQSNDGSKFEWAEDVETRNKLWKARHEAYYAFLALQPGWKAYVTDVCLPISNLTEAILHTRIVIDKYGLVGGIVGHVGDGNFHAVINYDPGNEESKNAATMANNEIVQNALKLNGTCTGEHGVGLGKKNFLCIERGDVAIKLMKQIKAAVDPLNIMNPGKVI